MKWFNLFYSLILSHFAMVAQTNQSNSLLWEISGNKLEEKSYIFGTIHLIPKEDFFIPGGMEKAFNESKTLYLELDMNELSDMSKLMSIMDKCYMRDGKKLPDLLSVEDYKLVAAKFAEIGLPSMVYDRMKPMFLTSLTAMDGNNPMDIGSTGMKSYEMELTEHANAKKMPLKGIESVEFQLSIFDSIPYDVQAKSLVESFKADSSASDDSLDELVKLYKEQDVEKLSQISETSDSLMIPYMNMMLKNRNANWIPVMKDAMKQGSCFFAVGAGHLGGKDGILELLRKNNYQVKPIY